MKYNNKNLILLIEEVIKEIMTDVVYHFTSMKNLLNILEINVFKTSMAAMDIKDVKLNRGYKYYFSVSRSKIGDYRLSLISGGDEDVLIKLNGQKLSNNYKSIPVDFFQKDKSKDEMEDRIVTNKPFIDNAMSYMEEIYISPYYFEKRLGRERTKEYLLKIEKLLKQNNIPFYIFIGKKNVSLDKNKAVNSVEEYEKALEDLYDYNIASKKY